MKTEERISSMQQAQALAQQSHERMQQDLNKLTKTVEEGFEKLWEKFDTQREENERKYATKDDHKRNEDRIDAVVKALLWVVAIIVTTVIWAVLKLVIW